MKRRPRRKWNGGKRSQQIADQIFPGGERRGFRSRLSKWISRARISRCLVLSLNYGRSGGRSEEVGSNRYESKWPRIGSMNSLNGSIRALPFAHRFPRELGFMLAATMTHPRMRPDLINCERSS